MELKWVLDTYGHGEVRGLVDEGMGHLDHQPAGTIDGRQHERRFCTTSDENSTTNPKDL